MLRGSWLAVKSVTMTDVGPIMTVALLVWWARSAQVREGRI